MAASPWRLIFVESVLNPVVLTLARWMCGRSATLAGTASLIKPPKPPAAEHTADRDDFIKHSHLPLHMTPTASRLPCQRCAIGSIPVGF